MYHVQLQIVIICEFLCLKDSSFAFSFFITKDKNWNFQFFSLKYSWPESNFNFNFNFNFNIFLFKYYFENVVDGSLESNSSCGRCLQVDLHLGQAIRYCRGTYVLTRTELYRTEINLIEMDSIIMLCYTDLYYHKQSPAVCVIIV